MLSLVPAMDDSGEILLANVCPEAVVHGPDDNRQPAKDGHGHRENLCK